MELPSRPIVTKTHAFAVCNIIERIEIWSPRKFFRLFDAYMFQSLNSVDDHRGMASHFDLEYIPIYRSQGCQILVWFLSKTEQISEQWPRKWSRSCCCFFTVLKQKNESTDNDSAYQNNRQRNWKHRRYLQHFAGGQTSLPDSDRRDQGRTPT